METSPLRAGDGKSRPRHRGRHPLWRLHGGPEKLLGRAGLRTADRPARADPINPPPWPTASKPSPRPAFAYALESRRRDRGGGLHRPSKRSPWPAARPMDWSATMAWSRSNAPTAPPTSTRCSAARSGVEYLDQMQFQMCVSPAGNGAISCRSTSAYRSRCNCYICRVPRDDKRIAKLEQEVMQFLIELDATVDLLRKRYMQEAA